MNEFIKILLSLSVSGALLFVLIFGLKPLYKNRFSRRWQYYIWIVVALRFLLPFTPDTKIVPDTNLTNTRAQHVYESLGFRKVRTNIDSWKDQFGKLQSSVDYELVEKDFVSYISDML